ncbi:MAG: hypothetical protein ACI8WB_003619 [Phenylobacterium sp.]|jgi:hypothetical protein
MELKMITKLQTRTPKLVKTLLALSMFTLSSVATAMADKPSAIVGQFQTGIAHVEGLSFDSGSFSGTTNNTGQFSYAQGESVTFSLGDTTLGQVDGADLVGPLNLIAGSTRVSLAVQNMHRFLTLLDMDNNVDNGIKIHPGMKGIARNLPVLDFASETFDTDVVAYVAKVAKMNKASAGLPPLFVPDEFGTVTTVADVPFPFGDGITLTPQGEILISGGYDQTSILKVSANGEVSEFVTDLPGPVGIDYDSQGNLFVANYTGNTISKVSPDGTVTTFATDLDGPAGLLVNQNDEILVTMFGANFSSIGATVMKFSQDGSSEVFATGGEMKDLIGIAEDETGRIFVSNWRSGQLFRIVDGEAKLIGHVPGAVNQITYANGFVYAPSTWQNTIHRASVFSGSQEGEISLFSGNGEASTTDGSVEEATFNFPFNAVASDDGKTIYVLTRYGQLRKISAAQ